MSMASARAWSQFGESLTGLGGRLRQDRETNRELARQKVEDQRRHAAEDRAAAATQTGQDIELARLGGGHGPAPTDIVPIEGTGTQPAVPASRPLFPQRPMTPSPFAPPPGGNPGGAVGSDEWFGAGNPEPPPMFRGARATGVPMTSIVDRIEGDTHAVLEAPGGARDSTGRVMTYDIPRAMMPDVQGGDSVTMARPALTVGGPPPSAAAPTSNITNPIMHDRNAGRFAQVGQNMYITKPELLAQEQQDRADQRTRELDVWKSQLKRQDLALNTPGISAKLRILTPGLSQAEADAKAGLMAENDVPYGQMFPHEPVERVDRGLPTFEQAYQIVQEKYQTTVMGENGRPQVTGYTQPAAEMIAEAQAMARGRAYTPPPAPPSEPAAVVRGSMRGYPEADIMGTIAKRAGAPAPATPPMPGPAPAPTAAPAVPGAAPAAAARRPISQDQADYLKTVRGMSDADIARLYEIR